MARTWWNRLEPRPRSADTTRSLEARVHDPLWFLTRQWQVGEFQGEDAASPAWVQIAGLFSAIDGWSPSGAESKPFANQAPLEALVESEPCTPDLATAVELGQRFEAMLTEAQLEREIVRYRRHYPLAADKALAPQEEDLEAVCFLRVCAGRAINGIALYRDKKPPTVTKSEIQLLEKFRDWVRSVYGEALTTSDAPAWRPERLEYGVEVAATTPHGARARFTAHPGCNGQFDWYAFDQQHENPPGNPEVPEPFRRSLLPAHVRFTGMPNARWWQFENGRMNISKIEDDPRELAKMAVSDFMLIQSNDWFMVPFTQPVGSLCAIDSLLVHDVFGGNTLIERADRKRCGPHAEEGEITESWTMFSTTLQGTNNRVADFFILPPSAVNATQDGQVLEEVRFMRDEMANMVWAIEHTLENGIGMPWAGHERSLTKAIREALPHSDAPLAYRLQNGVPEHWIPFLPVRTDEMLNEVALERAAMLRYGEGLDEKEYELVRPCGRILRPTGLSDPDLYQVHEEEVSRAGTRVSRLIRRSRWIDGSTHLWVARRKSAGGG